ncbi:hypothetical protein [Aeromicrobium sp. 9AM]|uniref:hypothetical protein n=1 Tax=Aeromicrobium sp. 9AM TaxID=2653126 RepID=UPI0012F25E13|nr:hypothetical protein [Aeromicrobium sp. 9AM]VXB27964.1 conserved hypothetical protein [Aeromicrobium sp. 9AM]
MGGPFENYAELYGGTTPAAIDDSMETPAINASRLTALATELHSDASQAGSHTEGSITGAVIGQVVPGQQVAARLASHALVAIGAIRGFAADATTFDATVKTLNDEYATRVSAANRERHDPDHTGPDPASNSAIEADLRPRYRTALRKLDDDAHHAAHLLRNPSDADIRRMFADGLLPLEALVLYPTITLTRDEAARALRLFDPPELGTPLEVLQLRLDLARSLGLDPRDYAQLLQVYWQSKALKEAGINIDDWDITRGAPALSDIIEKVYDYYGELFKKNPNMEWAGLANLVGPSFAAGFLDLGTMREILQKYQDASGKIPDWVPLPYPLTREAAEQLANLGEDEVTWFEQKFLSMQQQIFLDMGSMNQAYADGGMPAIQEMADAGLFEKTTNPYATDDMLDSWRVINDPTSTPEELHEAAYKMAYREQHDIIQDDYDDMRNHPGTGELVTKMFSTVGQVSVPGAHTMGQYSPTEFGASVTVDPWGPGKVTTSVDVSIPIPTGNVADWEDRWDYFTNDTLPAYVDLLDRPGGREELADIMDRDMGDRIDEFRIHHRIDDLAEVFVEGTDVDVEVKAGW